MSSQRDPFGDFARMKREMDELLGDFWDQAGYRAPARAATAFVPRVDVYYCGDDRPEKAVVKVDLPGVDVEAINLEVRGRSLVITGERPVRETEGRTYQQVELPSGPVPPRRRAPDRRPRRRGPGLLRGRHPARRAPGAPARGGPPGPDREGDRGAVTELETPEIEVVELPEFEDVVTGRAAAAGRAADPPAARDGHLPRHADPAGGRPGALDQAGERRPLGQPDARDGRLEGPRERHARADRSLRGRRRRARSRG